MLLLFFCASASDEAYADDGGWIGSADIGTGHSSGNGGGGGGNKNCDVSDGKTSYLLECNGYSWIFYKSVVEAKDATDVQVLPHDPQGIPRQCAEHTDQNGGFWHFGENARAIKHSTYWNGIAYFGDSTNVEGIQDTTYTYSTMRGSYGHFKTYTYNYLQARYPWAWNARLYRTYQPNKDGTISSTPMALSNGLYKNHVKIYEAEKFSQGDGPESDVWRDYVKAYKAINGEEPKEYGFPGNMYAFCYWEGMAEEYTLNVEGRNIYDASKAVTGRYAPGASQKGSENVSVSASDVPSYKFIGWKTSGNSNGPSGILSTTSNVTGITVSGTTTSGSYDNGSTTSTTYRHLTLNANMETIGEDKTVYAYYAPKCTLTIDKDANSNVSVYRRKSIYSWRGNINHGGNLYLGDELDITITPAAGYALTTSTVTGYDASKTNYTVGGTNGVCNNITVTARSTNYTLTVEGKNIYDNSDIDAGDKSVSGTGLVSVTRNDLWNSANGFKKFIGWKDTGKASSGIDDILTETRNTMDVYVSNKNTDTSAKYNNGANDRYSTLNVKDLTANKTVYAYYAPKCDLTIDPGEHTTITIDRIYSKYSTPYSGHTWPGSDFSPWSLYKEDEIRISFSVDEGYHLKNQVVNGIANYPSGTTYTISSGGSNATCESVSIWTQAEKNEFEGRVNVGSGGDGATTDWQKTRTTVTHFIEDCDPINGCEVKFEHALRRISGTGPVQYTIRRTSNDPNIKAETIKSNQTADPATNYEEVRVRTLEESKVTLKPGQIVCEQLIFVPSVTSNQVTLTACASALGKAQPEGDNTLLDMKVKNEDVTRYNEYMDMVYAKPGDNVKYRATYNPILQYTYNLKPEKIQINGTTYTNATLGYTLGRLFNLRKPATLSNWNNAFTVYATPMNIFTERNHTYNPGLTERRQPETSHKVTTSDVGKELIGYAETNRSTYTKTTPNQVTFVKDTDNKNLAIVGTTNLNDNAKAAVPYNFINTIEIKTEGSEGNIVYAGESRTFTSIVSVNKKTNSVTTNNGTDEEAYATIVPEAKVTLRLTYYNDGIATETAETTAVLLKDLSESNNGKNKNEKTITANVKDLPAGTLVCAQAGIYPANSGADTNWSDKEGSHTWAWSDTVCYTIAKRPSFEVLGGSLYSNGNISAPASIKDNLNDVTGYEYDINNSSNNVVAFGSWVEHAVVSNGTVKGLASGAATGLNVTLDGERVNGIAETQKNGEYCANRVPLSFANYFTSGYGCKGGSPSATQVTGLLGLANATMDYTSLVSYILGTNGTVNTTLTITNDNGEYILGGREIPAGTTEVVTAARNEDGSDSTILITGNIIYADGDGAYSALESIPKLIIYADNINIACNVSRVDAILIANNKIDTCPDSDGDKINEQKNNVQLTINGSLTTNTLELNRTYGARVGTESGIPAEIINYDTSIILWSMNQTATDDYAGMTSVYQHEIAPRY